MTIEKLKGSKTMTNENKNQDRFQDCGEIVNLEPIEVDRDGYPMDYPENERFMDIPDTFDYNEDNEPF